MHRRKMLSGVGLLSASFFLGCGGFATQCMSDSDCPATAYCNPSALACFVRSGGSAVPVIVSIVVGAAPTQVTVNGTAPANSTVRVYSNATCTGTPVGTGTANASAAFSVAATVPASGTLYATAESSAVGSVCSTGVAYP